MKWFLFYLGLALVGLSATMNFYVFEQIFSVLGTAVQVIAAILVAALMYAMCWIKSSEDKESTLIWVLCTKISVAATVAAIFISGVASENTALTVEAKEVAAEYQAFNLDQDREAQKVWHGLNRVTHASTQRVEADHRIDKFVAAAEDLEATRNGPALMSQALNKMGGGGIWIVGFISLLLALVLDLGQAKCTSQFRKIEESEKKSRNRGRNRTRTRESSYDTGTSEGQNLRYTEFADALEKREIRPVVRDIKEFFECTGETASKYLAAAAEDGILKTVTVGSRRRYEHV